MYWRPRSGLFLSIAFLCLSAALTGQQTPPATSPEFDIKSAPGNVTVVTSSEDPGQSYAVYLPSRYSPDRTWPIIYAFDPFARGKNAVEVYKDAAEKYGYIVAGSNNSRNGPTAPQFQAAQAMWADSHRRFAIDNNRVYTTGLSGGARVATSFALYCYTCKIAGVIAHGAGYPVMSNARAPANSKFVFYGIVGDADFNYPELMALRQKKDEAGEPCKVKVYPGPHQWAPPEVATEAIEWLELKAMQAGKEKVDAAFVQRQFEKTQAEAAQAEQLGDTLTQYYALRSLAEDFKGLADVSSASGKLAELKGSKALKSAERKQQKEIELQSSLTAKVEAALAQVGSPDVGLSNPASPPTSSASDRSDIAQQIVPAMLDLNRRGKSSNSDHLVYARAFSQLWISGLEAGQEAFSQKRYSSAIAYFDLMSQAAPDQPWPLLLLAEARVRSGNKKGAIKAIEQAVHRGLKRPQTLTQDPELEPLASDPAFQRIVQSLGGQ